LETPRNDTSASPESDAPEEGGPDAACFSTVALNIPPESGG
jgi:hypothetical protein